MYDIVFLHLVQVIYLPLAVTLKFSSDLLIWVTSILLYLKFLQFPTLVHAHLWSDMEEF